MTLKERRANEAAFEAALNEQDAKQKRLALALYATAQAVINGYDYTPGDSDLDDEQPIYISMTLGDYRKARIIFQ